MNPLRFLAFSCICVVGPSFADEAKPTPSLALELNALQTGANACRVTFLATNALGSDLTQSAFEVALFDAAGSISQLVSLDFSSLQNGKTKVLQFALPDVSCADIGRVLINDVTACAGDGIAPGACLDHLQISSKVDVTFGI